MPVKEDTTYISQDKVAPVPHRVTEESRFIFRRQREELGESLGQTYYWGFRRKGKPGQGKQHRIGLFE